MNVEVRKERPSDADAVRAVNLGAFETDLEARLVDRIRETSDAVSLVAVTNGAVVGHILFTPVSVESGDGARVMGLAPMAVAPDFQRKGIGSMLVRVGLDACRQRGAGAVVVLGHPEYYPRFGFRDAGHFGLRSEFDVPEGVFMALELVGGALQSFSGMVHYHPAFGEA